MEQQEFADRAGLADGAAAAMRGIIRSAIERRGSAMVALAGGSTPFPAYRALAAMDGIDWPNVTIMPTDERQVAMDDPLHNGAKLAEIFAPVGARMVQLVPRHPELVSASMPQAQNGAEEWMLKQVQHDERKWPIDLAVLGMGLDGHTASLFPGPDLERGFSSSDPIVAVLPDPLPAEAPVGRVSLSAGALSKARQVLLLMTGDDKRAVLKAALAQQPPVAPIARLAERVPMTLFWAA